MWTPGEASADALLYLPFDFLSWVGASVQLSGIQGSWKHTLKLFFVSDLWTWQKIVSKSKKGSQQLLLCSAVNHEGGFAPPSFFLSPVFDFHSCSSFLSPLPSISAVGMLFLSFSPNTLNRCLLWSHSSFILCTPRSHGCSPPLLSSLPVSGRTSMLWGQLRGPPLGGTHFSVLFPGCCSRKCARMH